MATKKSAKKSAKRAIGKRKAKEVGGRWLTITAASTEVDLSVRQLQEYAKLPGCPRRQNGKGAYVYEWPAFNRFVREKLAEKAVASIAPADFENARARKMAADAELAELELARERGNLITLVDATKIADNAFDRVRARLVSIPGKEAYRFVGLKAIPKAVTALRDVIDVVMAELSDKPEEEAA